MAVTLEMLEESIEKIAPSFLAEEWDNGGFQLKTSRMEYEKIFLCLELTTSTVKEAIHKEADLIITHHPLIFEPVRNLLEESGVGRLLFPLIREGISVYSVHTSFDKAIGGNNDCLISLLRLEGSGVVGTGAFGEFGIGRMFRLKKPVTLEYLCHRVQLNLDVPEKEIRMTGSPDTLIQKIGVCTGSGASLIRDCLDNECQLLITGDVRYHDAQFAKEEGLALLDAGHYHTEKIFAANFGDKLSRLLGADAEIFWSETSINPFE